MAWRKRVEACAAAVKRAAAELHAVCEELEAREAVVRRCPVLSRYGHRARAVRCPPAAALHARALHAQTALLRGWLVFSQPRDGFFSFYKMVEPSDVVAWRRTDAAEAHLRAALAVLESRVPAERRARIKARRLRTRKVDVTSLKRSLRIRFSRCCPRMRARARLW